MKIYLAFLLKAKCLVLANHLKVGLNDYVFFYKNSIDVGQDRQVSFLCYSVWRMKDFLPISLEERALRDRRV